MADTNSNANTAAEITAISSLVSVLVPTLIQFGIPLVEKVVEMIKKDPTIPASALAATIAQRLAEAATNNQAILAETT